MVTIQRIKYQQILQIEKNGAKQNMKEIKMVKKQKNRSIEQYENETKKNRQDLIRTKTFREE